MIDPKAVLLFLKAKKGSFYRISSSYKENLFNFQKKKFMRKQKHEKNHSTFEYILLLESVTIANYINNNLNADTPYTIYLPYTKNQSIH